MCCCCCISIADAISRLMLHCAIMVLLQQPVFCMLLLLLEGAFLNWSSNKATPACYVYRLHMHSQQCRKPQHTPHVSSCIWLLLLLLLLLVQGQ
jgi:hypothetical protein